MVPTDSVKRAVARRQVDTDRIGPDGRSASSRHSGRFRKSPPHPRCSHRCSSFNVGSFLGLHFWPPLVIPAVIELAWSDPRALPRLLGEADSGTTKALLKELVAEIRVESRDSIVAVFKLPTGRVRIPDGLVAPRGFEP